MQFTDATSHDIACPRRHISSGLAVALLVAGATCIGGKASGSPIALSWVHATVRIENEWGESGTGFLVIRKTDEKSARIFLITNKHVVNEDPQKRKDASFLTLFLNIKGTDGTISAGSFRMPLVVAEQRLWREHPDRQVDVLAVDVTLLMNSNPEIEKKWADYSLFATPDVIQKEEITVGEGVLIIGYPLGLAHARTNSPLVRQGIIATRIGERITVDVPLPGEKIERVEIPGFLVDSAVIPGSSGSPVVLKPTIGRAVGDTINLTIATPYLLGIVSSTKVAPIKIADRVFPALAGLGVVYDAGTIQETIELFFR